MKYTIALAVIAASVAFSGSASAQAIPNPPQTLCIDDVGCAPEPPAVGIKWHPGHYMLVFAGEQDNYATRCKEISDEPNVKGIKVRFFWKDIESSKGSYSVAGIRKWLDACSQYGKRLVIDLEPRSYNGGNDLGNARSKLPDYIIDDPQYGWSPFGRQGVTSKIWLQSVTDRWILLQEAVAAQLDSEKNLEAVFVGPGESAPGWHTITPPADYSDAAWRAQMQRRITGTANAWRKTIVIQGLNWLPSTDQHRSDMVAWMKSNSHVAMGGPDIFGDASRLTDGQKVYIGTIGGFDYRGIIPLMHDVQSPELGGTCGWDGNYSPNQILDIAKNTLQATHIFWIRNTCGDTDGNWETGILPVIRANASINTACPSNFGTCDRS